MSSTFYRTRSHTVDSREELKGFLGFMGINTLSDYRKRDPAFHYAPIADRITRNYFLKISRYFHFVDNNTLPRGLLLYDRLGKVRPLINHFSEKFKSVYLPDKYVAINEVMIKFTGHSSLKQYMPMKPIKRGMKVWVLGDSSNGYFCNFRCTLTKWVTQRRQVWEHESWKI